MCSRPCYTMHPTVPAMNCTLLPLLRPQNVPRAATEPLSVLPQTPCIANMVPATPQRCSWDPIIATPKGVPRIPHSTPEWGGRASHPDSPKFPGVTQHLLPGDSAKPRAAPRLQAGPDLLWFGDGSSPLTGQLWGTPLSPIQSMGSEQGGPHPRRGAFADKSQPGLP